MDQNTLPLTCEAQFLKSIPAARPMTDSQSVRLGFEVANVDETFDRLTLLNGEQVASPQSSPWGRRAVMRDPDGYNLELTTSSQNRESES
jgi:predicted enzyme related to lactoylglutathione lyase